MHLNVDSEEERSTVQACAKCHVLSSPKETRVAELEETLSNVTTNVSDAERKENVLEDIVRTLKESSHFNSI